MQLRPRGGVMACGEPEGDYQRCELPFGVSCASRHREPSMLDSRAQRKLRAPRIGVWSGPVEPLSLVLLGCRVTGPSTLSPPAARRAWRAVQLYRSGALARILACGGKKWCGVREADALCAFLAEHGVPEYLLERELESHSTRHNAHHAATLWLPRGLSRVGLVTCDWHMPRALACFRGAGFEAEPLPAPSPRLSMVETFLRNTRERLSLGVDGIVTRGFSRV